jgi:outer membrane protein insertion porin family
MTAIREVGRRAWVVGLLLAVGLTAAPPPLAAQQLASPAGRKIADVVVADNKVRSAQHILAKLQSVRKGGTFDEHGANRDVALLLATGWFAPNGVEMKTSVRADETVTVYVHVKELGTTVREITFVGNQHYSETTLLELSPQLRRGAPLNPAGNRKAAAAIAQKMREDGRYYATCTLTRGGDAADDAVTFNIVEGPVVRVGAVEYRGNSVRFETASGRLATVSKARGPMFGFPTVLTPTFTPQLLDLDKKSLLAHYHQLGFLDAMIDAEVVPTSYDLSTVKVIYHVHEGKPYTVNSVRIEGNTVFSEKQLRKYTEQEAGKLYDDVKVRQDAQRLGQWYGSGGYQVKVIPEQFVVPGKPNVVDVCYRVFEAQRNVVQTSGSDPRGQAPPARPDRVGEIKTEGNLYTRRRVILNEIRGILEPGQVLDYGRIDEARQLLMRRGLFDNDNPPTIEVDQSAPDSEYKDIIIRVQETQTGQAGLQLGVNSNAGVSGMVTVNQRNFDITRIPLSFDDLFSGKAFRGAGQELRLTAMPGQVFQRYDATWREPYLFDSRFGLTANVYFSGRGFNEFNENRYGGRFTLDYRFDNNPIWGTSFSTRIEGVDITSTPFDVPDEIWRDRGQSTLVGLRAGVNRDTRDSFLTPSTGSVLDLGVEQVLGDYQFPIGTAEFTKFWTVHQARDGGWKGVLAYRSSLTVMAENAPVFERVFAGGFRSIRGFQFRGVGPFNTGPLGSGFHTGGTFAMLSTLEYQLPLMANERVSFVAFADWGTVNDQVELGDYRAAVGVGLRLKIPGMGPLPIALDFGFPVKQQRNDIKQLFSFYVGWIGGQ